MNYQHEVSRSFATLREMLSDRGEDVASLETLAAEDVVAMSASRTVFSIDLPSCRTRVIYDLGTKFKPADVRKLLEPPAPHATPAAAAAAAAAAEGAAPQPPEAQLRTFVVISREQPSNAALKGIHELGLDVQLFQLRELQYNVSHHESVPRHEPIRDEPAIEVVTKRYGMKSRFHMPLIQSNDPMARYLALKHGQLVRITRLCSTAGEYVLYRCCTSARG